MEKTIVEVLNAGIGLFGAGKDGLEKARVDLEKVYTEISAKGAQDNSEASVKLRESVDKILADIKEFSSVAGKNYEDATTAKGDTSKIDEIVASIQKATNGGQA